MEMWIRASQLVHKACLLWTSVGKYRLNAIDPQLRGAHFEYSSKPIGNVNIWIRLKCCSVSRFFFSLFNITKWTKNRNSVCSVCSWVLFNSCCYVRFFSKCFKHCAQNKNFVVNYLSHFCYICLFLDNC